MTAPSGIARSRSGLSRAGKLGRLPHRPIGQSGSQRTERGLKNGVRGRDCVAHLRRQWYSLWRPSRHTWRATSGRVRACSRGRADRRLRRQGKHATAGAGFWKNRAAWNAPNACVRVRRRHRRASNTCIIFKRLFETIIGQESLINGSLAAAADRQSSANGWLPGRIRIGSCRQDCRLARARLRRYIGARFPSITA